MNLRDHQPCDHPGCLNHISHPCEGCGRVRSRMSSEEAVMELSNAEDLLTRAYRKMLRVSKGVPGVEGGYPLKDVIIKVDVARMCLMLVKDEYEKEGTNGT